MSTSAIWLFVVVLLLFLAAVAGLVLAGRSVLRKGRRLLSEADGLREDLEQFIQPVAQNDIGVRPSTERISEPDEYAGYERRVLSRQEEVDYG